LVVPWVAGAYQQARLAFPCGQADLVYRDNRFFLFVTVDVGDVPPDDPQGFLGVDLGIQNIAADSDGDSVAGAHLNGLRARHARLRAQLQRKGTKSAKRLLWQRRTKERRFAADVNHRISKALVRKAKDTGRGIAVENLTGIHDRVTVRRPPRRSLHSWAFHQLRAFLTYKARLAGVVLVAVDPRYTSQTCPECGCIDRTSRPSRDRFQCVACGHAGPADTIAAGNIASRAAVMRPDAGSETALASRLL
jgi:IS605 OrfB family transposase